MKKQGASPTMVSTEELSKHMANMLANTQHIAGGMAGRLLTAS